MSKLKLPAIPIEAASWGVVAQQTRRYDKKQRMTYSKEEEHLIDRIVMTATNEGVTLEELITMGSTKY